MASTTNSIDYAIRVCESIAFSLHSILGIFEPCTGCLRFTFKDRGAFPSWAWPVAGILLAIVATLNFYPDSENDWIIVGNQIYICCFHIGAMMYHLRIGHHPATTFPPSIFVFLACIVISMRMNNLWWTVFGILPCCVLVAGILTLILVTPPSSSSTAAAFITPSLRRNEDDDNTEDGERVSLL